MIPRPEYPRPQFERSEWLNLNGEWDFEFDFSNTGIERDFLETDFSKKIIVPFCPESSLSGIGNKDFMNCVWYRRKFKVPKEWKNVRVLLNFEAVDYHTEVWINNKVAGSHTGGYTPFSFDITKLLCDGENTLTLRAQDNNRTGLQPRGKQSSLYHSHQCDYTRTTGIWQTVWLEAVPLTYTRNMRLTPDIDNSKLDIELYFAGDAGNKKINVTASYNGKQVGSTQVKTNGAQVRLELPVSELHLWEAGKPELYDLELSVASNSGIDKVKSYFGMRSIELAKDCMLINGRRIFQRLILDQGFYPDGIYTAPSDQALIRDIELSLAAGFNGARLHEKVFERRFLYHADRMGYIVWGEYANWGLNHSKTKALGIFLPEWLEALERDYNSPAIIGWCPFNETWDQSGHAQCNDVLRNIYLATKAVDRTRPVIDTSGNFHVITDIYDIHEYTQNVEEFTAHFKDGPYETFPDRQHYKGQPYFVSEYGGIWWDVRNSNNESWGYGNRPTTEEEFVNRYIGLADVLLSNKRIFGLCYTQLTDVEQETNGLYYYDRTPKFSDEIMKKLKAAMTKKAAIED